MDNKTDSQLLQNAPEILKDDVLPEKKETASDTQKLPEEIGGRQQGLEPTRYGDWEFKGRCIDF
jgi:hypothetical protein